MPESIAIIGAGNVGTNLGRTLVRAGHAVTFGLRDPSKVASITAAVPGADGAPITDAVAGASIIFLAVPASVAVDAVRAVPNLAGKILVDCTNPVAWDAGPVARPPAEGSVAAAVAAAAPTVRVVKGFNAFGAEIHADPRFGTTTADAFIAGDDADAKARVVAVARSAGFEPIDAGPLRNAALLEHLAVLWIHLATVGGHGRQVAFKLLNRE